MKKSLVARILQRARSRRVLTSLEVRQLDMFWDAPNRGGFNYDLSLGKAVYGVQEKKNESQAQ